LLAGLASTPLVIALATRLGIEDVPSSQNWHSRATPLLGGAAILVALGVGIGVSAHQDRIAWAAMSGMVLFALVGLADDLRPVRPLLKLGMMVPGAVVPLLLWPETMPVLLYPVFVLALIYAANAVNLLDNMDGLTSLMSAVSAAAYGFMALLVDEPGVAAVAFAIAGGCVAFLFFNYRLFVPAAIFLGDMGALALGAGLFLLAAYLMHFARTPLDYVATLAPIALVMLNAVVTIGIRKRKGLKALSRSKDHISERLYRYGIPRWEITLWFGLMTLLSAGTGVVAWWTPSLLVEIVAVAVGVLIIAAFATYTTRLKLPSEGTPVYREKTICRIITRLDVGGPAQHCSYLSSGLSKRGWTTHLLHGNIDEDTEDSMEWLAEREGAQTHRIVNMQREIRPLSDIRAFMQIYGLLKKLRPQIVHTHHAKAGLLGRIAAGLCGVPVIVHTFHGLSLRGYFGPLKNRFFLALERLAARISTVLVATGPNDRNELIELGVAPGGKFTVIPLGLPLQQFVDLSEYRGQLRSEIGIPDGVHIVTYIGRMVDIKNIPSFVDMAAAVAERRDDVHFILVGDGPLRHELEQQADRLGISDRTTFYGVTDNMRRIYADADLVVLCSKREGMSLVMMEALAAGCPVVSTRVGDVSNSVIDGVTGRMVPPSDTPALSHAVLVALDDMARSHEMAKAGQQHVLTSFSIDALIERIDSLYTAMGEGRSYEEPVPWLGDEAPTPGDA
ncbi:MAG: glycosyltransferase, partial [Dehalococcoidia bacterium]|nr:glycosyltransferase [Dehalococcoidia bacterium]